MIRLTIDGKDIEVAEGTTVLRAAQAAGIHIPTLCDHPQLVPTGGCRLCVVEVEGFRTVMASCALPASNGMVVRTDTPALKKSRELVLTLLFSERNHFCMYCQMTGGDCELQNAAYGLGMTHWPIQPEWQPCPVDASHPDFILDNNRCILCRRCIRACSDLVGNHTLGVEERGAKTMVIADWGVPLGESSCVSCGNCLQVCPTGALIDRVSAYQGRVKDTTQVKSTCVGCSVGCATTIFTRDNRLVRIEGDWDGAVNQGILCKVGRFEAMSDKRARISQPLVRKNGKLESTTWDEALDLIAARLGYTTAALASTRLPAEALSLFKQLFAGRLGSSMVTSIEEHTTNAAQNKLALKLGHSFEGNLHDLQSADVVVAIGADLIANHQVAGFLVKRALPNGVKLIVIDTNSTEFAGQADVALQLRPGTDRELLEGLAERASAEQVSQATGVPVEALTRVGQIIWAAKRPVFVYGKGLTSADSTEALEALRLLAQAVNGKLISTKGKANSAAAALYGLDQAFDASGAQAVYLALGDDEPSKRLIERVRGTPFVAVQASYTSPVTELADVVLPVTTWAEQSGHYINLEGRVQEARAALVPPASVRSNADALKAVAARLGAAINENWRDGLSRVAAVNVE